MKMYQLVGINHILYYDQSSEMVLKLNNIKILSIRLQVGWFNLQLTTWYFTIIL